MKICLAFKWLSFSSGLCVLQDPLLRGQREQDRVGREGERHSPPQRQHLTRRAGAQRQASYSGQKCYRFNEDNLGILQLRYF